MTSIKPIEYLDRPLVDGEDNTFREPYMGLEPIIRDLKRAALLACRQTHEAIGELRHDAGKCAETPDADDIDLAVLTVDDVHRRAKELEDLYDAGFRS
jgi:hypothetical protein